MSAFSDALARALEKRSALQRPDLNAYRLLNAHADGTPGLTLDRFADVLVLSAYEPLSPDEEQALADEIESALRPRSLYLKRRPKEARVVANTAREKVAPELPLRGEAVEAVEVLENGARFVIRPAAGLSVGLFLDMRDVRAWLKARVAGKTVLNCFSYTCGFSVAARLGKAARAVNIDLSRRVLEWGEANHALNGLSTDRRDFISGDVFDWLGRFQKKAERFDVIVLDPPSFATTRGRRFSAERDYPDLVAAAAAVLAPGGLLLSCCNLRYDHFERDVREGLDRAGRRARGRFTQLSASSVDFPPHPSNPHRLNVVAVEC